MEDMVQEAEGDAPQRRPDGRFLTFLLGESAFALHNDVVREVVGMTRVTRLPRTPAYVEGVINLRGKVIPVIDLRSKLGLSPMGQTAWTRILVVWAGSFLVGLIVDRVAAVVDVEGPSVEPLSPAERLRQPAIIGLIRCGERAFTLLDVEQVLGSNDFGLGRSLSA